VTPFGVELPSRSSRAREQPGTLVFVGDFSHPPNVDAACWLAGEIMPRLRPTHRARLLLVGGNPSGKVRALAADDIEVVGQVPTIDPYLDAAAIVLAPVRTGRGMRMKVLRALAAGKAVVTTSRGTEGFTLAGEDLPLVVADDPAAIARATAMLLDDEDKRWNLGHRARAFVAEHYSADAYGRRLESVYEEAVAARSQSETARRGAS
jgi:polysaccharide biosynthesis protein PslH